MPGPRSKITLLDEKFRTRIADMVKDHVTNEEIAAIMNGELEAAGLDMRLSTAGVTRYSKQLRDATQKMTETQEFARQLALDLGQKENDQTFDLIVEMLSHLMFKMMRAHTLEEKKDALKAGDFMKLTISIKNLSDAKLKDLNYRREIEAEARKQAAKISTSVAREAGLSEEAAREIRRKIMGAPE